MEWTLSQLYNKQLPVGVKKLQDLINLLLLIIKESRTFHVNEKADENQEEDEVI